MFVCKAALLVCACIACGSRTELPKRAYDASAQDADLSDVYTVDVTVDAALAVCGSSPAPFAYPVYHPDQIVVDDTFVYFHSLYGLDHLTKNGMSTGTSISTAAAFGPQLDAFAVVDGAFFLAVAAENFAIREPVEGGEAIDVETSIVAAGFALSATHVYTWPQTTGTTAIDRIDFDGTGVVHTIATLPAPPTKMVFDGEVAYATTGAGVYSFDLAGDAKVVSYFAAIDIAIDATNVYFTTVSGITIVSRTTLVAAVVPDTSRAFALTLDPTDIYFTEPTTNKIRRVNGKVGAVVDVASIEPAYMPIDIAVDAHCLYWTNDGKDGGAVMTMAKP